MDKQSFYEVVSSDSEYGVIPENFTSSFAEDYVYYKSVIGDSDKCLWVKKDDTEHTNYAEMKIETSDYIYSVDSAKRVCAISSKKGEGTANISFKGPSSSTISAITDGVGRKYDWQTGYDANGNPTSYRGETVTWNGRLMTSFTKDDRRYEYSYNSDGMRTVKRVYEGDELVYTYTYIWDGDVLLAGRMEVTDADEPITIRYLYDDSGELYGMDYNGNGYYGFIKNLQGDIVSIVPLDSESNVELNIEYDAWGKPIIKQASSAAEGFLIAVMMLVTNVGYRGYFYDFETGLYYLRSRYYDPEIGRFINADDTAYLGYNGTPLSLNLFAYCENNPVNYLDYWGYKANNSRPNVIEGQTYGVKYVASYTSRVMTVNNKKEYNYIFNLSLDNISAFAAFQGYIIKISNWQNNLTKIFQKKKTKALANVLLMLSRKIKRDSLSGRSVDGTAFELLAHYVWYKKGILKKNTTETDCGSTNPKSIGYDNNAYIFEKDKNLLTKLENYVAQNKLVLAVALLSKTLTNWDGIK